MKLTGKARWIYIPLRNALIVMLCLVCGLFWTEKLIERSKSKQVLYNNNYSHENFNIRYLNYIKTPAENRITAVEVARWLKMNSLSDLISQVPAAAYPLIDVYGKEQYPDQTYNIVVIGDSFVWGDGCTNRNELFWRQLEQMLQKKGYQCRVYGVGMGGANAYEELSWLIDSDLVENLSPDLVLFGYVENDAKLETDYHMSGNIDWNEELPWLHRLRDIFPHIYDVVTEKLALETMYNQKYGEIYYGDTVILKGEAYDYYKENFVNRLDNYAAKADFPVIVMTLPREPSYDVYHKLYEPLYELYAEAGNIFFYDCLNAFCEFDSKEHSANYAVNPANRHPGAASHYFYADYISAFLEKDFSLSDCCEKAETTDEGVYINDSMPGNMNITEVSKDEIGEEKVYRFTYPSENTVYKTGNNEFNDFLYQPINEDYVKLCFSCPVEIGSLSLECTDASDISLWYTKVNETLGYDDHSVFPIEKDSNGAFIWGDNGLSNVTSICVHADITGGNAADIVMTVKGR